MFSPAAKVLAMYACEHSLCIKRDGEGVLSNRQSEPSSTNVSISDHWSAQRGRAGAAATTWRASRRWSGVPQSGSSPAARAAASALTFAKNAALFFQSSTAADAASGVYVVGMNGCAFANSVDVPTTAPLARLSASSCSAGREGAVDSVLDLSCSKTATMVFFQSSIAADAASGVSVEWVNSCVFADSVDCPTTAPLARVSVYPCLACRGVKPF